MHLLDETLINGGFVGWVKRSFWPGYSTRMFFWFNAGAAASKRLAARRRSPRRAAKTPGYLDYQNEPWRDVNEFSRTRFPDKPLVGPFYANLGGFLTALLYGLTGLEPGPAPPEQ